jgi:hypothetical protein
VLTVVTGVDCHDICDRCRSEKRAKFDGEALRRSEIGREPLDLPIPVTNRFGTVASTRFRGQRRRRVATALLGLRERAARGWRYIALPCRPL